MVLMVQTDQAFSAIAWTAATLFTLASLLVIPFYAKLTKTTVSGQIIVARVGAIVSIFTHAIYLQLAYDCDNVVDEERYQRIAIASFCLFVTTNIIGTMDPWAPFGRATGEKRGQMCNTTLFNTCVFVLLLAYIMIVYYVAPFPTSPKVFYFNTTSNMTDPEPISYGGFMKSTMFEYFSTLDFCVFLALFAAITIAAIRVLGSAFAYAYRSAADEAARPQFHIIADYGWPLITLGLFMNVGLHVCAAGGLLAHISNQDLNHTSVWHMIGAIFVLTWGVVGVLVQIFTLGVDYQYLGATCMCGPICGDKCCKVNPEAPGGAYAPTHHEEHQSVDY